MVGALSPSLLFFGFSLVVTRPNARATRPRPAAMSRGLLNKAGAMPLAKISTMVSLLDWRAGHSWTGLSRTGWPQCQRLPHAPARPADLSCRPDTFGDLQSVRLSTASKAQALKEARKACQFLTGPRPLVTSAEALPRGKNRLSALFFCCVGCCGCTTWFLMARAKQIGAWRCSNAVLGGAHRCRRLGSPKSDKFRGTAFERRRAPGTSRGGHRAAAGRFGQRVGGPLSHTKPYQASGNS